MVLVLALLVLAAALGVLGLVIEGLVWLAVIGLGFAVAAAVAANARRSGRP